MFIRFVKIITKNRIKTSTKFKVLYGFFNRILQNRFFGSDFF